MEQQTRDLPMLFKNYIEEPTRFEQLKNALPAHFKPERMIRLALTAFSQSEALRECHPSTIFASILAAATVGLEIGVDGQAYLVPYKGACTFVPGWKGIVDIVMRGGRAMVWTGAVYEGDVFEPILGSTQSILHKPLPAGKKDRPLIATYSVGSINGHADKVIEVWYREQLEEHFNDNVNEKLRPRHYRWKHEEMYFRKVPLLQVCKYMPKSIELNNVLAAAYAAETQEEIVTEGGVIYVNRQQHEEPTGEVQETQVRQPQRRPKSEAQDVQAKEGSSAPVNPTDASPLASETERNYIARKAGDGLAMLCEDAKVVDFDKLTKAELARCRQLLSQVAA